MKNIILCLSLLVAFNGMAQEKGNQPKLLIGVVVDQMRYDYLNLYWNDFGENGFKKLVQQGFAAHNVHYNYKPTYTGPGHASIFTGATPAMHGIVGNNWYSRSEGKVVYCAESLNSQGEYYMSPERLKGRTIADQCKLFTKGKGKAFGISLKDRGAILPAGFLADGAYWFDSKAGKWISSNYYSMPSPTWLNDFNQLDFVDKYLKQDWTLSLAEADYSESNPDDNNFENELYKGSGVSFPYNLLEAYRSEGMGVLKGIPQGNSMTTDLALLALKEEQLGLDNALDFLSVSYSATDYVGHRFGVGSREVQDTYIKLDQEIAKLLTALNEKIGKDNYVLFLTSDHGAGEVRNHLKEIGAPHGNFKAKEIQASLDSALDMNFGPQDWLSSFINYNLYFNQNVFNGDVTKQSILTYAKAWLVKQKGIRSAWTESEEIPHSLMNQMIVNGFHPQESGDIILLEHASWTTYSDKGSTHGSPYTYDTHVPLLIYGSGVKPSSTRKYYPITSIAPTIAQMLGVAYPELSSGENVIKEIFK